MTEIQNGGGANAKSMIERGLKGRGRNDGQIGSRRRRASDPDLEADKFTSATSFVSSMRDIMGQSWDDATMAQVARKVAQAMPPYRFRWRLL